MILFDGNYRRFFGRLGKVPGFLLALITISLLGPLGSTPRCIALSYTTLKAALPGMSPVIFSAIACGIIFLFTISKNRILTLLGWVLTPFLLGSLISIIIIGVIASPEMKSNDQSGLELFLHGLKEGYNTMDLLAAFFFSSTILHLLRMRRASKDPEDRSYIGIALRASVVGGFLLTAIYIGFSYLSSFHGQFLDINSKDELLSAITMKIAGPYAGLLVCISIVLACLTTAIALITSFSDFIQTEVFDNKISYKIILIASLALTFFISTFEFTGISAFLGPVLQVCYPGLIILTFLNIAYKLKDFRPIKVPVFCAFALSAFLF